MAKDNSQMPRPFFWLHITKAGGSSVKEALKDVYISAPRPCPQPFVAIPTEQWNDNLNNYRLPLREYDFKRALFAKKYLYSQPDWERMFKFVVVRNPYDRAVSSWLYHRKYSSTSNRLKILLRKPTSLLNHKADFQFFLEKAIALNAASKVKGITSGRHFVTHTAPIFPDITCENNRRILVDYIGKLETIEKDFNTICASIELPKIQLPTVNSSRRSAHYSSFYTQKTRKLVEKFYGSDIDAFEYKFESI